MPAVEVGVGLSPTLVAEVLEVERHGTSREPTLEISVVIYEGPIGLGGAHFDERTLGSETVRAGETVSVEVWHRKVTAMTVDQRTYRSFVAQAAPWWLVPMGLLLLAMGVIMIRAGVAGTYAVPRRRRAR